jgi:hypothetical protein
MKCSANAVGDNAQAAVLRVKYVKQARQLSDGRGACLGELRT